MADDDDDDKAEGQQQPEDEPVTTTTTTPEDEPTTTTTKKTKRKRLKRKSGVPPKKKRKKTTDVVHDPPTKVCNACHRALSMYYFSTNQWRKDRPSEYNKNKDLKIGRCKTCMAGLVVTTKVERRAALITLAEKSGKSLFCTGCHVIKNRKRFPGTERRKTSPKCQICWDKVLCLPRQCNTCREIKDENQFSKKQWHDYAFEQRQCFTCFPIAKEDWLEALSWALTNRKRGYQCYSCPHHPDWTRGFATGATALFTKDDLVGTYDIFYHYGVGPKKIKDKEQRTTAGTLTVEMKNVEDDEGQQQERFVGSVTRPRHLAGTYAYRVWGMDYFFRETNRREHGYDGSAVMECSLSEGDLRIYMAHLNDWPNLEFRVNNCVEIRRCDTKVPLFWRGREQDCTEDQKVSETTNLVEAEELLRRHEESYSQNSWIGHHLPQLNTEIAGRIHGYIGTSRPPPVLFIEPGDLCITTRWSMGRKAKMTTYEFARRRPSTGTGSNVPNENE
jgi:Stc1 domain